MFLAFEIMEMLLFTHLLAIDSFNRFVVMNPERTLPVIFLFVRIQSRMKHIPAWNTRQQQVSWTEGERGWVQWSYTIHVEYDAKVNKNNSKRRLRWEHQCGQQTLWERQNKNYKTPTDAGDFTFVFFNNSLSSDLLGNCICCRVTCNPLPNKSKRWCGCILHPHHPVSSKGIREHLPLSKHWRLGQQSVFPLQGAPEKGREGERERSDDINDHILRSKRLLTFESAGINSSYDRHQEDQEIRHDCEDPHSCFVI